MLKAIKGETSLHCVSEISRLLKNLEATFVTLPFF